jgi:hypothetical protein
MARTRTRTLLLSAALGATVVSGELAAATTPAPRPSPLRLDEALPMLAPFRHAAGNGGVVNRYVTSTFGSWFARSWLSWPPNQGPKTPALSRPEPCLARMTREPGAWPLVHGDPHWFVDAATDPHTSFDVATHVVPPWMRRIDVTLAEELLTATGCGRGGECSPGASYPGTAFATLWPVLSPEPPIPPWWVCVERPVRVMGHGRENEKLLLLRCDGSIPEGTLEKLSILARPQDVPHPAALPLEPAPGAARGEWVPGIRLLHPRMLWVLHRIALSFPWKAIYIYSGYRPRQPGSASKHGEGRALDIAVHDVKNETLFKVCRKLEDVGCGYYPNNRFVHIDVRSTGSGHPVWVDTAAPGEASRYVDSWPGVIESGGMAWAQH